MAYTIEWQSRDSEIRKSSHGTIDDAKFSLVEMPANAAIYEGDSPVGGRVVAVWDHHEAWIDVEHVSRLGWWHEVPQGVRDWMMEHPRAAMHYGVWDAVVRTGGAIAGIEWRHGEPSGDLHLIMSDEDWTTALNDLDESGGY